MKLQQLLTIALVSICSLMLTACEVDNSENGTDYLALLKETHWQLSQTYVDHEWQTPAVYDEVDIKDLWFHGDKSYQISIFNFDGNRGDESLTTQHADNALGCATIPTVRQLACDPVAGQEAMKF